MNKTVIFYHIDLDGHLSGAILQDYLINQDPIMVRINYNDEFPWHLIDKNTEVWMADFCIENWSQMDKLYKSCKNLVWIDHHITSIEKYEEWSKENNLLIPGLRRDGTAACRLCWEYCNLDILEPECVMLAGVFDTWDWHNVEGAVEFQYGTKLYETDPATKEGQDFWKTQFDHPKSAYLSVIDKGRLLMNYQDKNSKEFMKKAAFETTFHGHKVIAVNRKGNSRQFNSIWDPNKYEFMVTFAWIKGQWSISLYAEGGDIHLGNIAKQYGGGGHKGSAGFESKKLPFDLK